MKEFAPLRKKVFSFSENSFQKGAKIPLKTRRHCEVYKVGLEFEVLMDFGIRFIP